jgi:hypothetical protein
MSVLFSECEVSWTTLGLLKECTDTDMVGLIPQAKPSRAAHRTRVCTGVRDPYPSRLWIDTVNMVRGWAPGMTRRGPSINGSLRALYGYSLRIGLSI